MRQLTRSDERYERIENMMPPIVQASTALELFSGRLETMTQNLVAAALVFDKIEASSSSGTSSDATPDSNMHITPIALQAVSSPHPKTKKKKTNPPQSQTGRNVRARSSISSELSNSQLSNSISQPFVVYREAHPSAGLASTSMLPSNSAVQKPTPDHQLLSSSRHPRVSGSPGLSPILPLALLKPLNSSRKHPQPPQNEPMNKQNQNSLQERETATVHPRNSHQQSKIPKLQSGGSLPSLSASVPPRFDSRRDITAHPESIFSSSGRISGSSDARAREWPIMTGTEENDSQPVATATAVLTATSGAVSPARDLLAPFEYNRPRNVVEATRVHGSVSLAVLSPCLLYIIACCFSARETLNTILIHKILMKRSAGSPPPPHKGYLAIGDTGSSD